MKQWMALMLTHEDALASCSMSVTESQEAANARGSGIAANRSLFSHFAWRELKIAELYRLSHPSSSGHVVNAKGYRRRVLPIDVEHPEMKI